MSRYLYWKFDCMSLSCHVRISEWIHILYLPECQDILCPKRSDIWRLSDSHGTRSHKHLVLQKTLNHLANRPNDWSELWESICTEHLILCHYRITYIFQNKSRIYNCLNVKKLLGRNRNDTRNLSDCNGSPTHNHLVFKKTLNHLAKPTKWLGWIVSRYLYGEFDCMSLSCPVRISEWIHTLYLPKCQDVLGPNRNDILN